MARSGASSAPVLLVHIVDAAGARGSGRCGLARRQSGSGGVLVGLRQCLAGLGDARRRLGWAERVQAEDALDLGCHRGVHLGRRRVVVAGLARGQAVLRDRRREGRLHLGHRARHGQRQPRGRWRPDRQALCLEVGRDLRDGGRRRAELLRELRRCQEVVILRRTRIGDLLHLGRQRRRITWLQRDGERQCRRSRCGSDEGGAGRDETLMPRQLHPPAPRCAGARRGRSAVRHSQRQQEGDPHETRGDALQPTAATSIHVHLCVLHRCPPGIG